MEGFWLFLWSDALPTTRANVDEMLMKKENWPRLVALTSFFFVELPGIEPGSYGIPSRLLRAQFAMSLLGSLSHANKPR
jgi:hypothetical protein